MLACASINEAPKIAGLAPAETGGAAAEPTGFPQEAHNLTSPSISLPQFEQNMNC
jgi:hypothetical protein